MLKIMIHKVLDGLGLEVVKKSGKGARFWPSQRRSGKTFFANDQAFHALYELAQSKTDMAGSDNPFRRQRHHTLTQLLKFADMNAGDVCELGSWRGLSAYQIAHFLRSSNKNVLFHIFDSFEGLSEIETADLPKTQMRDAEANEQLRKEFACSLEIVKRNLSEFDFIRYYKGWVPERFHEVEDRSFSFVHIDLDLYQPIRDSFEFFYPKLIKNGIMVFDDYGSSSFPGAKRAIDECLEKFGNPCFLWMPSGTAFLLKNTNE